MWNIVWINQSIREDKELYMSKFIFYPLISFCNRKMCKTLFRFHGWNANRGIALHCIKAATYRIIRCNWTRNRIINGTICKTWKNSLHGNIVWNIRKYLQHKPMFSRQVGTPSIIVAFPRLIRLHGLFVSPPLPNCGKKFHNI